MAFFGDPAITMTRGGQGPGSLNVLISSLFRRGFLSSSLSSNVHQVLPIPSYPVPLCRRAKSCLFVSFLLRLSGSATLRNSVTRCLSWAGKRAPPFVEAVTLRRLARSSPLVTYYIFRWLSPVPAAGSSQKNCSLRHLHLNAHIPPMRRRCGRCGGSGYNLLCDSRDCVP